MYSARLLVNFICLLVVTPGCLYAEDIQNHKGFIEERRLRLWSAQTDNRDLVRSTYRRIDHLPGTDPGSWVYEWSEIGDYFADQGEGFANAGNRGSARAAFLKAAKFYGIARFPAKTLPGQLEAYRKHLHFYQRAGEFFEPPLLVVDIPFKGGQIHAYLHRPPGAEKPPLILWNGGIDTWKGDVYQSIQPFLDRGFAVMTFDVLGTGESSNWVARPDSNTLHSTVIDYMQSYPLVDGRYIAHVGFSFSGYYAARNAITEDRLFAVIAACGPVHYGWENIDNGSWEIKEALSAALHLSLKDPVAIHQAVQKFSLLRQGLLQGPDSLKVPTLVINGDLDDIAPVSDLRLLADSGQQTDLWIMGGDRHCFGQYRSIVMPRMADWLLKKLVAIQD